MLVADDHTNPLFKELCDAAAEIAQLKAQISRLEKTVDGVLAQHLAGQDELPAVLIAPDVPLDSADPAIDLSEIDLPPTHLLEDAIGDDHDADALADNAVYSDTEILEEDEAAVADAITTDLSLDNDWSLQSAPEQIDADQLATDVTDTDAPNDETRDLDDEDRVLTDMITATDDDVAALTPPLPPTVPANGMLPSALRSLICRPLKSALNSPDDLTLIKGIDCATALELTAYGLNRFEDIAALDADKIRDLHTAVAAAKSLHKQAWIEQAAVLAEGNLTTFARKTRADRAVEDTAFTLKPELIELNNVPNNETPDFTASEIILDEKISFDRLTVDKAACVLNELAMREMPRQMHIDRKLANIMCCRDDRPSFLPVASPDAGFSVDKIAHIAPQPQRDYGNVRAFAASLGAAAVIYIATVSTGVLSFDTGMAQLMETDVCALTSWSSYPDACKQIFGRVL